MWIPTNSITNSEETDIEYDHEATRSADSEAAIFEGNDI